MLSAASAIILFEEYAVASGKLDSAISFPSASVADLVVSMTVSPGTAIAKMLAEYELSTLTLQVQLHLDSDIFAFSHHVLSYHTAFNVSASTAGDWDRTFCSCKYPT